MSTGDASRIPRRPVKSPYFGRHIDQRTETRPATDEDLELAAVALEDLERERLVVTLLPAPVPSWDGHMVRAVEQRNPDWYSDLCLSFGFQVKRQRVEKALERVIRRGTIRGNGYERAVLALLKSRRTA